MKYYCAHLVVRETVVRPCLGVDGGPERLRLDGVDGEFHPDLVPALALKVVL